MFLYNDDDELELKICATPSVDEAIDLQKTLTANCHGILYPLSNDYCFYVGE